MHKALPHDPDPARLPWRWMAALALPFSAVLAVALTTGWAFPVFWDNDEWQSHWPLIQRFAGQLPRPDLRDPGVATTPLFHLLGAVVVRLFGPHLPLVWAMNALVSVAGVLALFGMLRRRPFGHEDAPAALLAAVFGGSCYFFGYSFRALTDNLALVFALLAMRSLFRFADPAADRSGGGAVTLKPFFAGCGWLGLAVLTRQSYLFLGLAFGGTLLWVRGLPVPRRALGLAALAGAALPFAGLVLLWGGLIPPNPYFRSRHGGGLLHWHSLVMPLLVLGAYAPFFPGRPAPTRNHRRLPVMLLAASLGLVAVVATPLDRPDDTSWQLAGWIHNVAGRLPSLHGNSLALWVLLPWGAAVAVDRLRAAWERRRLDPGAVPAGLFLLGVLSGSMANHYAAQKYSDGLVLLFFLWETLPADSRRDSRRWAWAGLIALFCAHHVVSAHANRGNGPDRSLGPAIAVPPPPLSS